MNLDISEDLDFDLTLPNDARSTRDMETIDLSSDEDEMITEDDDIAIVTVRPKSKSRLLDPLEEEVTIQEMDPLNESTQIIKVIRDKYNMNMEEKSGYVKELIEENGLGMLFSMECGLVLFHVSSCFINGQEGKANRNDLQPGTRIKFMDCLLEGEEFRAVSEEGCLRQAVVLWIGDRPQHLLKKVKCDKHEMQLRDHRWTFLDLIRRQEFTPVSLVRHCGKITGFLNRDFGLLEMEDEDDNEDNGATMVLFHVNDLYVFRSQAIKKYNDLLGVFPPGLKVFFDARTIPAFRGVTKQAIAVFAGSWPAVPHPTRLAQGPKSKVQCYDLEDDQEKSFFYLELSLKERLDRDLGRFREYADRYGTDLRPQRLSIECGQDQAEWRRRFIPQHLARQQNGFRRKGPKKHFHEFKKAGPYGKSKDKEKTIKLEDEGPTIKLEPIFHIKAEKA